MGVSIQETHPEGVLQIADRARDDRVGDGKFIRRLRHAPGLRHRKQNVQIAQFDPPSDPIVPAHAYPLAKLLIRCRIIVLFSYDGSGHVGNRGNHPQRWMRT